MQHHYPQLLVFALLLKFIFKKVVNNGQMNCTKYERIIIILDDKHFRFKKKNNKNKKK